MSDINTAKQQAFNMIDNVWMEWKHVSMGISHCPICLVLDKCWFQDVNGIKRPQLPQHPGCHCKAIRIAAPVAGQSAISYSDIRKFTEYLFTDKSNGKKELFELLGYDITDSATLKAEFERQAQEKYANGDYKLNKLDMQGQRIEIEMKIERTNGKSAELRTGWLVYPKGKVKFITAYGG